MHSNFHIINSLRIGTVVNVRVFSFSLKEGGMGLNPVQLARIAFSFYATTSMAVTRVFVFLFFVFVCLFDCLFYTIKNREWK